ncbi:transketolase [Sandaracinobacter neustonicus]|uniref:Transketolase n=1 Tax=Sandaracinobacter neustonicus TaxID=1715348 RepID=A0A501XK04_9SPHN|nr:transketolase [Sandaracinobacter neustonicus]TPE61012.1 transketolase [Sandaracinobacter neustonicus]
MASARLADDQIRPMANCIRALAMDAVEAANSGHPGMPMGMADAATILWGEYLKFDASDPRWPDRDRFVLSAGHGSMLIYALLYLSGFDAPTIGDIRNFRQLGSPCAGHPENFELPGVECTTGPLGQGLAMAVGMAIAERHLNAGHGDALVNHRTWVIAGDGCLMEGISHEAVGLAGHLKLGRLNVLWDDNNISIDGPITVSSSEDVPARFRAAGWHVVACDGHDPASIRKALDEAQASPLPSLIRCTTVIGFGAPNKAGTEKVHGSPLGAAEVEAAKAHLGWTAAPFEIPADLLAAWRGVGARGKAAKAAWEALPGAADLRARMANTAPVLDMSAFKEKLVADGKAVASRKASEMALDVINAQLANTIGGSADLTGSNLTRSAGMKVLDAADYGGRYLHYGIREFGMSAAMNGMALHGGVIPYGGTFLVFADYARGAIRLSALQQQGVIYVLTHDSIGLGEDGPTHQPIEHLASLRAIPNVAVYRPADAVETAECWELALADRTRPSVLALSRQNLPTLRKEWAENRSAEGGYRLLAATAPLKVVLVATGSEVAIAVETAKLLEAQGVGADVVSMPSWELYREKGDKSLLPADVLKVSVEAASTFGWERIVGADGLMIGIDTFGASAPAPELYQHFGLTSPAICERVLARLNSRK